MINFDEQTHTYTNEQGTELISVTTLLKRAGISPSYGFVKEDVLKAAAEKGTIVHKEIEDYIKKGEIGFTTELHEFISYIKENNIEVLASEKVVYDDKVAGTIDLIVKKPNGKITYVDFKTTSTIHTQSVSWQLSLYKYLDLNNDYENYQDYLDADLEVWHFLNDGSLEIKGLLEVTTPEIDRLYECYVNGTEYKLLTSENDLAELYEAEKIIEYFENEKTKAEENVRVVRERIIESMKKQGITHFENDKIIITYIPPTQAENFDSKRFRQEQPEIANQYIKIVDKKEQVRIKLKESKDE